jgi:hypothetical protein
MFAISVKSVPGCFVLIVPRLIGVPVAANPGFVPHDDVLVDDALALLEVVELVGLLAAELAALLELLLLPHPARTAAPPNATSATIVRTRMGRHLRSRSSLSRVTISSPPSSRDANTVASLDSGDPRAKRVSAEPATYPRHILRERESNRARNGYLLHWRSADRAQHIELVLDAVE